MALRQSESIEVKRVKHKGRGVFARRLIRKGELIERVPVILLPASEFLESLSRTSLANYCFDWEPGKVALALGFGSLYNHSYRPNARYDDVGPQIKEFTALHEIAPGTEITINYNGKPWSRAPVWFEVVEPTPTAETNGSFNAKR